MHSDNEKKQMITRIESLSKQRKKILSLDSEKALAAILDYSQPAALVHSFAEEDLYFLIHDIGIEDSYPLLTLASDKQWEYIVDLETWQKDRVELISVTKWLDLLFRVDPKRFIYWFMNKKTEFVELYLSKNVEVKIRENDQDAADFGDDFITYDDTFYIRLIDDSFAFTTDESGLKKDLKTQREAFIYKFIEVLAAVDHVFLQKVLLESSSIIPAETEENEYRLRCVRLAEKGFMPFDEAVGIYQPLRSDDVKAQIPKFITTDPERRLHLPAPLYFTGAMPEDSLFASALRRIHAHDIVEQLQLEFTGICNRIIAADQKLIRERKALKNVVRKVCGYISIGLEGMVDDDGMAAVDPYTELIQKISLADIFRVGYGYALHLKWRAEKWRKRSWFEKEGLLLSFWGEEWTGVLGGLLLKKPLFYDHYATGVLYREFMSMGDIKVTEQILNEIIAFDDLLSKMNVSLESMVGGFLTYKNFILTVWVKHHLGADNKRPPLSLDELERFFDDIWTTDVPPRKIGRDVKAKFLAFLSERTGEFAENISQKLGHRLESLFNELEDEYGEVSAKELDPRYIRHFFVGPTS